MDILIPLESETRQLQGLTSGRFKAMFPGLAPQGDSNPGSIVSWLTQLGMRLEDDQDSSGNTFPAGDHPDLPAGYTYLGQFIDHDITLDPTALPDAQIDTSDLTNFRSPALDLDSLLGFGPSVIPYLYERNTSPQAGQLMTAEPRQISTSGSASDLPRLKTKIPIIGDPRNDENLIIGQLHTAMITFYNRVVAGLKAGTVTDIGPANGRISQKAARIVRWHYQWIVLHDFLPRLVEQARLDYVVQYGPQFYKPASGAAYMPIEFAGAAYRFGHSMVREKYHINKNFSNGTLREMFKFSSSGDGNSLPVPDDWLINWNRFFPIDPNTECNLSRRLDPYIARTLHALPIIPTPPPNPLNSLVVRNLLRGWSWKLPSGQSVAAALNATISSKVKPLTANEILADSGGQRFKEADLVERFDFHTDTPLWYYIMKEASVRNEGKRLGDVGSIILSEVFVGLMLADPDSYLTVDPSWKPTLKSASPVSFTMTDLFNLLPSDAVNILGGDTGPL